MLKMCLDLKKKTKQLKEKMKKKKRENPAK